MDGQTNRPLPSVSEFFFKVSKSNFFFLGGGGVAGWRGDGTGLGGMRSR